MKRSSSSSNIKEVENLRRTRPRDWFLRWSMGLLLVLIVGSWLHSDFRWTGGELAKRWENSQRFLGEVQPAPLRDGEGLAGLVRWAVDLWRAEGAEASMGSFAMSVAGIALAGLLAMALIPWAARNFAESLCAGGISAENRWICGCWRGCGLVTRMVFVLWRALPEYLLAYFLVILLGVNAWPAVLAMGFHNAGILGRLGAEIVENAPRALTETSRAAGAGRASVYMFVLIPHLLNRFLVFFSYRWESCLRDSVVLGLLGFTSLGFSMMEARAHDAYDEMLYYVMLAAFIVAVGDLVTGWIRRRLR